MKEEEKQLQAIKQKAKKENKGLIPYIDNRYSCRTCGSNSGESHPDTSFCFICNTDNWQRNEND